MPTLTETLVDFVLGTAYEAIPEPVIARTLDYVLDLIGVTLVGTSETSSQIMARTVLADGGKPEATVFGAGRVTTAGSAALINGTAAHAVEMDDDHRLGTVHVGAVVIPAALAAAEAVGSDGQTFLRAVVMGYEVMCRVGEALLGKQFYAGFHPTSSCGVYGSAAAAAVIYGLDRRQFVNALGIAGTQSFGLGEWRADGSWIKRMHPGRAAQTGVFSAKLAQNGFTGPATILEGKNGWLQAFSYQKDYDAGLITRDLGKTYTAIRTAFKPYPGCRFAHTALDLGADFYHVDGLRLSDIERVDVRVYKTDILNYDHKPATPVIAQFCVPYLLSAMLVNGQLTLDDLTPGGIANADILSLAARTDVVEDPDYTAAYPELYKSEVKLTLKDGRVVARESDVPRGDPDAPEYQQSPTRFSDQIADKFRTLVAGSPFAARIAPIIQAVDALPTARTLDELAALLADA